MSAKESKVWIKALDINERSEKDVEHAERLLRAFPGLWALDDEGWEMTENGVLVRRKENTKKNKKEADADRGEDKE